MSESEPKLTEVTIPVRVPIEVAELMKRLCSEEIDGVTVLNRTIAQVARDALIKGIREMMRDRGMI